MEKDFHYYATYCAAYIAGFTHEESVRIAWSAAFVDNCSKTFLARAKAPLSAATTQLQMELMEMRTDVIGLQEITRIWTSFHFLPRDLYAPVKGAKRYRNKYRLLCGPNGPLLKDTIELAKSSGTLEAIGLSMHVLADTWAHMYFIGTTSLVFNTSNYHFYEKIADGNGGFYEKHITFRHNPGIPDDAVNSLYTATPFSLRENAVFNLGHGRLTHLPDYAYARYRYMPSWKNYEEVYKDNPEDFYKAFCQMIYALKYLRGATDRFETDTYDFEAAKPYEHEIRAFFEKRQIELSKEWKALSLKLSGKEFAPFEIEPAAVEYIDAGEDRDNTALGRFIKAALAQKSMVTNKVFKSGNLTCGYSVNYEEKGLKGIKDYFKLLELHNEDRINQRRKGGEQ